MVKLFDADGNEVEAFSQEELDAKLQDEITKKQQEADAAAAAKAEADRKAAESNDDKTKKTEAQLLAERLERLEKDNKQLRIEKLADQFAGNDPEKRKTFMSKFERLTGYEETADGFAERAQDAVKLAFGAPQSIDTTNLGNAGGRNINDVKHSPTTEVDKTIQAALGISADDVKKYSGVNNENK